MTPLERHAAFFDPEGTGFVSIGQTWEGLGRLGVALPWRVLLPPLINGFLGYLTAGMPFRAIPVDRIPHGKHPFDTGVFGDDGAIDEEAFAALERGVIGGAVTVKEMRTLVLGRGNRRPQMGRLSAVLGSWFSAREIELLFCLAADTTKEEDGRRVPAMTTRNLRRFYEGSLLHTLARRRRMKKTP